MRRGDFFQISNEKRGIVGILIMGKFSSSQIADTERLGFRAISSTHFKRKEGGIMKSITHALIVLVICGLTCISLAQEEVVPSPRAASPSPVQALTELPTGSSITDIQTEMQVFFNDMAPPIISDKTLVPRLKIQSPQWAKQQLEWLRPTDIQNYKGRASPEQIKQSLQWISRVLKKEYVPRNLNANLIPLRNWAILYRDWIDHGGSDTFVVKYTADPFIIRISETPNYVIIAVRDTQQFQKTPKSGHPDFVLEMARRLLTNELRPRDISDIAILEESASSITTTGFWAGKPRYSSREAQDKSKEGEQVSDSVKFFTDGEFVMFQVLKYIWTSEMANPFDPRFSIDISDKASEEIWRLVEKEIDENPELSSPEQRIKFYERMKSRIITKQVEEYLGPLLYDYEGNKLTATIPIMTIEKSFNDLNEIQREHLLVQRRSDEYYVEGLKAFNNKRYDLAVDQWSLALEIDPLNVRCALLLNVAIDFLKDKMLQTRGTVDFEDPTLSTAVKAQLAHKQAILKYALSKREFTLKEREIAKYRVKALEHYAKGEYQQAVKAWDEVLKIEPSNPDAALFKSISEKRLKAQNTNGEPGQILD
jgi:tetratricopeptide (TPR) repeat protein